MARCFGRLAIAFATQLIFALRLRVGLGSRVRLTDLEGIWNQSASTLELDADVTGSVSDSMHDDVDAMDSVMDSAHNSAGIVYVSLNFQTCDDAEKEDSEGFGGFIAAASTGLVPLRAAKREHSVLAGDSADPESQALEDMFQGSVTDALGRGEISGEFTSQLPCTGGDCKLSVSLVHPFYGDRVGELSHCSKPVCEYSQMPFWDNMPDIERAFLCTIDTGNGMGKLELFFDKERQMITNYKWKLPRDESPDLHAVLRPFQHRQEPLVLGAYKALRTGIAVLKDGAPYSEFLSVMRRIGTSEVLRTRELTIEWIVEKLPFEDVELDRPSKLLYLLCRVYGPDGHQIAAKKKYKAPKVCRPKSASRTSVSRSTTSVARGRRAPASKMSVSRSVTSSVGSVNGSDSSKSDVDIKPICQALTEAMAVREAEASAVAAAKSPAAMGGLLQGLACGRKSPKPRTLEVLVIGAGPVGLLAAIHSQLSARQCGTPINVTVVEKRLDFATRTNVVHLTPASIKLLKSIGATDVMTEKQRLLLEGSDKTIAISQLQRALWRVAQLLGVQVRRGMEFRAYCPPLDGKSRWFAVTKKHQPSSDFDTVKDTQWAGGTPPDEETWDPSWLRNKCEPESLPTDHEYLEYDVLVAAEGPRSLARDQARHFEEPVYGEKLSKIHMEFSPTDGYGMTVNYDAHDVDWRSKRMKKLYCRGGDPSGYTFMSERWCYHALLLFESNERDSQWLQRMLPSNGSIGSVNHVKERVEYAAQPLSIARSDLLYSTLHLPDISVFKVGFQHIRGDKAAHVMMSSDNRPMMLFVVGDAYAPGFFPLSNGVNKGFDRINLMGAVGGMPALTAYDGVALQGPVYDQWAKGYNKKLKLTRSGSEQISQGLSSFRDRRAGRGN